MLYYRVPESITIAQRKAPEMISFLRSCMAFDLLAKYIQDELVKTYFAVVQPHYPFLIRYRFARVCHSNCNPPSILLLGLFIWLV